MSMLDRFLGKFIETGDLTVETPDGVAHYGRPDVDIGAVRAKVADRATSRRIARNPALGAGEAFMDGRLVIENDDIMGLLTLIMHNLRWENDAPAYVSLWRNQRLLARFQRLNDRIRARRNVAHHYDLDDRLYDLFLDADRQYSCAYFAEPDVDLGRAQQDKLAHIAAKLQLEPGQRVLDIGCGWGGLALYINRISGAEVLGITLSEEQLAVARRRAEAEGVADKVRFELQDYRDVEGVFDRIVSVGMFEHVGRMSFRNLFETVHDRLASDGVVLLHSIARADGPGVTDPFTAKYIFPGGYAPALSEVVPEIERARLWITDIEILRRHYAETLLRWYDACRANREAIEKLYDARFYRMWTYYLAGARNAFLHGGHMVAQIQMTRRQASLPITRSYMAEAEERLRKIENLRP